MPKARDENKISKIHQAALQLVIRTGFGGLKMADVAKEAGMATGTLYIYYKGREELINGLYVETKKEIISVLLDPAHQAETLYNTFRNMWEGYFSFCFQNPDKMMFTEQFLYSGYISQSNVHLTESLMEPLNEFLRQAIRMGLIREMDIEILKAHMSGSIHEIVKHLHRFGKSVTVADKTLFFDLIWNSIRK